MLQYKFDFCNFCKLACLNHALVFLNFISIYFRVFVNLATFVSETMLQLMQTTFSLTNLLTTTYILVTLICNCIVASVSSFLLWHMLWRVIFHMVYRLEYIPTSKKMPHQGIFQSCFTVWRTSFHASLCLRFILETISVWISA